MRYTSILLYRIVQMQLPVLCTALERVLSVHGRYMPSTTVPRPCGSATKLLLSQTEGRRRPANSAMTSDCACQRSVNN